MAATDQAIATLEGEAEQLVWIVPLSLGYIYTISGSELDFALAILSIGGARLFVDIMESDKIISSDGGEEVTQSVGKWVFTSLGNQTRLVYATVLFFYTAALVNALIQLGLRFDHTDPVLVGLAGVYWGSLVIVVMNECS